VEGLFFHRVRFFVGDSGGVSRIVSRADSIITMMRWAETIGPKSNMDQVLEPQELTDGSRAPQLDSSSGSSGSMVA